MESVTVTNLKALEIWSAQSLCDIGIMLSIVSFLLHLGRPYFERLLARFQLRVAADIWWLMYVLLRDGSLFLAALFGFWNLNLDLMADIKMGLPFVPLATVFLSAALLVKTFQNSEDLNRANRIATYLVTIGAALNTLGYVLVMEAPGEEYEAAKRPFWQLMNSLRSNANPQLSTLTFYATIGLIATLAVYATARGFRLLSKAEEKPK